MAQLVHKVDNLEQVFRQAGIKFIDHEEFKEVKKALERVPITQVRWSIVKVNELNEPLEGE